MTATEELDPIAQAIAALTTAARGERKLGEGTPNEQTIPADFGEIACHVLTSVAANVGGIEELLAGRSGSWEASYVRQIVQSTAGDDETQLLSYRTEPLRMYADADHCFNELRVDGFEGEAYSALETVLADIELEMFDHSATDSERTRRAELAQKISTAFTSLPQEEWLVLHAEVTELWDAVLKRAEESGHPQVKAAQDARHKLEEFEALVKSDKEIYFKDFAATVRTILTERGVPSELELVISTEDYRYEDLLDGVEEAALARTPLPMTGEVPDWSDGTPADAVRRAGRTYLDRLAQQKRGSE